MFDARVLGASEILRTELIFLPDHGTAERVDDCIVVRTPDNPTFWWGNALYFDQAPRATDVERWTALFERHVRAVQPASKHTTFGWSGDDAGAAAAFGGAYEQLDSLILAADRGDPIAAPHRNDSVRIGPLGEADWPALVDLHTETRHGDQPEDAYRVFAERRVVGWRALEARGQGGWFGAWSDDGTLLAALGVYAEAAPDRDGVRLGRFQNVATAPQARRQGLCGTLVAEASKHAFDRFGATRLIIAADEHDVARRVYAACGYRLAGHFRGLERGAY